MSDHIIHLSDLHFGTHQDVMTEKLLDEINLATPRLVIISGDFTQIGSRREYQQARDFLNRIESPHFCVPGNHDIPRLKLFQRFFQPFKRYKEYIDADLCPVLAADDFVVAGVNTARSVLPHWNWAHGSISSRQTDIVRSSFIDAPETKLRIFVCHHPLHEAEDNPLRTVVFGGKKAMKKLIEYKTDLILTGHVHHASSTTIEENGHRMTAIAASTALSSRLRMQDNGYNAIFFNDKFIDIKVMRWNGNGYDLSQEHRIERNRINPA